MSIGGGGGGSSSSSTSTTPWTNIANQLAGFLGGELKNLGSGSNTSDWIKSLTASSERQTKLGVSNIRESFAGSGLAHSTDIMKSIGDFQTQQTTALNTQISQVQQMGIQDQLSALAEIISLASGSGKTSGSQSNWGLQFAMNLLPGAAPK